MASSPRPRRLSTVVLLRTIKIVPQTGEDHRALGSYHAPLKPASTDRPFLTVRATIDLREQITKIEPQPVITRQRIWK
jgi:hypothetical protein